MCVVAMGNWMNCSLTEWLAIWSRCFRVLDVRHSSSSGESGGEGGASLLSPICFHFHKVFGKNYAPGVGDPPPPPPPPHLGISWIRHCQVLVKGKVQVTTVSVLVPESIYRQRKQISLW